MRATIAATCLHERGLVRRHSLSVPVVWRASHQLASVLRPAAQVLVWAPPPGSIQLLIFNIAILALRAIAVIVLRPHLSFVGCLEADICSFFIAIFLVPTVRPQAFSSAYAPSSSSGHIAARCFAADNLASQQFFFC